jgi:hypothetical protein
MAYRHLVIQAQMLGLTAMCPLRSLNEAFLSWDAANIEQRLTLCDPNQCEEEVDEGEAPPTHITEVAHRE